MALLAALKAALRHQAQVLHSAPVCGLGAVRWFAAAPNQLALIKELRDRTGAPISDVKSALQAGEWDLEKAAQELRKKGLAAANKKSSRHAAEGLVGLATAPGLAAIVEINSETDFVARNDQFMQLVSGAAAAALQVDIVKDAFELDFDALRSAGMPGGGSAENAVATVASTVRENIRLRRGFRMAAPPGSGAVIGTYLHAGVGPSLGRIASLLMLEPKDGGGVLSGSGAAAAQDLAHKLAMHVVGALPRHLDRSAVPESALEAERAVLREQAARSGKPAAIVDKMVEGRLNKFYEEVCLLEQPFILDDKQRVGEVVAAAGEASGVPLRVSGFVRVRVGEGLEAVEKDFAAEVAETLKEAGA